VTALLGLVPPDELVMRTGGPASCRTLDLAGKDPHANGMEISTALKTTSIILHRKASSGPKNRKWAATRKIDEEET
jgi:hypothetical protein